MEVGIGEIETVQTVIDNEERLSFCCFAPPLRGMEEYVFCPHCEEHTEFLTEQEFEERMK